MTYQEAVVAQKSLSNLKWTLMPDGDSKIQQFVIVPSNPTSFQAFVRSLPDNLFEFHRALTPFVQQDLEIVARVFTGSSGDFLWSSLDKAGISIEDYV